MPWEVRGNCVYKKGESEAVKCHGSSEEAKAHMKALYASESKETTEETEETKDKAYTYVPGGIFSFKDLDAYKTSMKQVEEVSTLTHSLRQLIDNIMYFPEIKNKSAALRSLVDEFASRVDGVETKELVEDLTKEKLDRAAAGELDPKEKRELRQGYEALGVSDEEIPDKVKSVDDEVLVWKEADGSCKVAFIYSNNYRDDDGFPEIIEEKAHKAFTGLVNEGMVDKPEMWHWHIPGTRWGQIDHMLYHDGFSVAFGTVDPGKEAEAQAIAKKENVGVSHGMPKRYVMRNGSDPSRISFYISKEISDLPIARAANKLTGLTVFEGDGTMEVKAFDATKREYLKGLGYTDEQISNVEAQLTAKKEQAEADGRESKEKTEGGDQESNDTPNQESSESSANKEEQVSFLTKDQKISLFKEIAEGMGEILKPLAEKLEGVVAGQAALKADIDALTVDKAKKTLDESPSLSFKELMAASVFGQSAQINGNSSLAKDKPQENKNKEGFSLTGVKTIDEAFAAMAAFDQGQSQ